MRQEEHDGEGAEGRAGGDDQRYQGCHREAEDQGEQDQGGQDGYEFPPAQVGREDRGDVVLKGRGPRHIGRGQS